MNKLIAEEVEKRINAVVDLAEVNLIIDREDAIRLAYLAGALDGATAILKTSQPIEARTYVNTVSTMLKEQLANN